MTRIGVLALQGDFLEHRHVLEKLEVDAPEVRLPKHLEELDGLIIPGGESTTIGRMMAEYSLVEPLRKMAQDGFPVWGTCAGMIIMARDAGRNQPLLACMDLAVERNAFGRQVDSFEGELLVPALASISPEEEDKPFPAVFIRAPLITAVGQGVEVLARLPGGALASPQKAKGSIVAARQGNLLATAFHPELTPDTRFHRYFLSIVQNSRKKK